MILFYFSVDRWKFSRSQVHITKGNIFYTHVLLLVSVRSFFSLVCVWLFISVDVDSYYLLLFFSMDVCVFSFYSSQIIVWLYFLFVFVLVYCSKIIEWVCMMSVRTSFILSNRNVTLDIDTHSGCVSVCVCVHWTWFVYKSWTSEVPTERMHTFDRSRKRTLATEKLVKWKIFELIKTEHKKRAYEKSMKEKCTFEPTAVASRCNENKEYQTLSFVRNDNHKRSNKKIIIREIRRVLQHKYDGIETKTNLNQNETDNNSIYKRKVNIMYTDEEVHICLPEVLVHQHWIQMNLFDAIPKMVCIRIVKPIRMIV